jgi:hypothetical protein
MSANSLFKDAKDSGKTITNEWSIYPPEPAVRSSIVQPVSDQRPATATPATDSGVQQCRYCTETLPPGARECPLCLREVADPAAARRTMISKPATATAIKIATSASPAPATLTGSAPIAAATQAAAAAAAAGGAVYTLESPALCPECDTEITTIHVIRVMRTQVSFTSTLPRKAYVISCPACRKLLSAGLSGLL